MSDAARIPQLVVERMLTQDAYSQWLGLEVVSVEQREVVVRMQVRAEMANGFGVAHGGIAYALADSAFAFAANTQGKISLSIRNDISYAVPVRIGDELTAHAIESSPGEKIAVYDVSITNQDLQRVALFRGMAYRTTREVLND
ncbi:MAG: hotdog fold thioesterase [Bdellovibrionales bacterium]|nr:hotdog fold thioesterase [Bdellovibrionales bacterium]